jgi:hypothetical protein
VRISNQDSVVHVALGTGWGSGEEILPGGTVEHRFPQSGIYAYSCHLHPGMNGAIVVGGGDAATPDAASPDMSRAAAVVAGSAPAELASSPSSPASDGPDARFLAVGGVAGALFGSLATNRWAKRRPRR